MDRFLYQNNSANTQKLASRLATSNYCKQHDKTLYSGKSKNVKWLSYRIRQNCEIVLPKISIDNMLIAFQLGTKRSLSSFVDPSQILSTRNSNSACALNQTKRVISNIIFYSQRVTSQRAPVDSYTFHSLFPRSTFTHIYIHRKAAISPQRKHNSQFSISISISISNSV